MRSKASAETGPAGLAKHQTSGAISAPASSAAAMAPALGTEVGRRVSTSVVRALQRREAAGLEEVLPARRHRREGMALVLEAADGDAHRAQSRTRPAVASAVSASTRSPAVAHSGVMLSASLWLMPPWQGVKSMTEGTRRAR